MLRLAAKGRFLEFLLVALLVTLTADPLLRKGPVSAAH